MPGRTKGQIADGIKESDDRINYVGIPSVDHDADGYEIEVRCGFCFLPGEHVALYERGTDFRKEDISVCTCDSCKDVVHLVYKLPG